MNSSFHHYMYLYILHCQLLCSTSKCTLVDFESSPRKQNVKCDFLHAKKAVVSYRFLKRN